MTVTAATRGLQRNGDHIEYIGGASTADNEVLLELDARGLTDFYASSTAGAFDMLVSHDGVNYLSSNIAVEDLTATAPATRVVTSTANKPLWFKGRYRSIKFMQNGATGVTNFCLNAR